jgi:hypothetical protein
MHACRIYGMMMRTMIIKMITKMMRMIRMARGNRCLGVGGIQMVNKLQ